MTQKKLIIRGAREHNLKNINLELPRDQLVVITGLSGSGKSSLAFDTIYAEGQRRYVESLSAYARQFLGQMNKPDVDQIEGLSPAISIDQKGASHNPRSTVGTVTEIHDYLRLLYARVGTPHCPNCGREVNIQTTQQIVDAILDKPDGSRVMILAPLVRERKGEHKAVFEDIRKAGFVRVRVDGVVRDLDEDFELEPHKLHTIEAVVDRLVIRRDSPNDGDATRLADSVETALKLGDGAIIVQDVTNPDKPWDRLFSEHFACVYCGVSLPEIEPRLFSFNSPHGACPVCGGLGVKLEVDPELVLNPDKTLAGGAIRPWAKLSQGNKDGYYAQLIASVANYYNLPLQTPVSEFGPKQRDIILYGGKAGDQMTLRYHNAEGELRSYTTAFEGVVPHLQRRYKEAANANNTYAVSEIEQYMSTRTCPVCGGHRLRPEALAVTIANLGIHQVSDLAVTEALNWFKMLRGDEQGSRGAGEQGGTRGGNGTAVGGQPSTLSTAEGSAVVLTERQLLIAGQIFKEIIARLQFMRDVGLDYLTLSRAAASLSGGESQRIRLATQIGSQLMGCLYILDEPSIGLHQRDNERLIETLKGMRDLGNTVLVVEHDEDTIRSADWIVDMGPGAGKYGGEVVWSADRDSFLAESTSLTAQYLRGDKGIPIPAVRRTGNGKEIVVRGAKENNLKNIDVKFPLGKFVCVTGVSGSGKSSLVVDILYNKLAQVMYRATTRPGRHDSISGIEHIDKVIDIDQSPIGRTPRSNPATYTGLFGPLRDLYASLPESKLRGYKAGRFSFNVKGGRCEACEGDGIIKIEMQFLPDVYVPCEVCQGQRYNRETLQIKYKGKNITEALDMTVAEGLDFFSNIPAIRNKLETLQAVGLSYVTLGQPATTLSGGEAQRVKLSKELSRRSTGKTLYILDEPTTGLHFADIERLLAVLGRLVDAGNTVIVIEHNLDVIKSADWIIDIGPEGGQGGGRVVSAGAPELVAAAPASYTGQWLKRVLTTPANADY
ncbi:MAG: excinuclease ABC subunit UvrA [Anaerolineae bacterium]|nr:excinuclease ABC subunit UvrA [Anaerolineales bacterium]MCQ3974561.1 excinuclease ABC subunit UvrA [Anaerolineae bacterium]